jgi:hypothetical protein
MTAMTLPEFRQRRRQLDEIATNTLLCRGTVIALDLE